MSLVMCLEVAPPTDRCGLAEGPGAGASRVRLEHSREWISALDSNPGTGSRLTTLASVRTSRRIVGVRVYPAGPHPAGVIWRRVDATFVPERYVRPMFSKRAGRKLAAQFQKGDAGGCNESPKRGPDRCSRPAGSEQGATEGSPPRRNT